MTTTPKYVIVRPPAIDEDGNEIPAVYMHPRWRDERFWNRVYYYAEHGQGWPDSIVSDGTLDSV